MKLQTIPEIKKFCIKNQLFHPGDKVIIGFSGGADSVFLVHVLYRLAREWKLTLHLVHVHHGIRGQEADRDEHFCREMGRKLELPVTVFHGNVPELAKTQGMSEEEAGRSYRYHCLEEQRQKLNFDKIAVAHHREDQAETVLFQILRGSSLRGMGGMSPVRDRIVRPLLGLHRQQIEQELNRLGQSWCEDSTNQDTGYSRNWIRHQLLPLLEEKGVTGAADRLTELSERMRDIAGYMEEVTRQEWERMVHWEQGRWELETKVFRQLHPALQSSVVMKLLEKAAGSRKDITSSHIEALKSLAWGETGKRISLPYGLQAGKDYDILWLRKLEQREEERDRVEEEVRTWDPQLAPDQEYLLELSDGTKEKILLEKLIKKEIWEKDGRNGLENGVKNNCTKWFDYAKINGMLEFRHPQEGDYFLLDAGGHRKKLNRFMIDEKISREKRDALWVLAQGSHILWIPELGRTSAGFYVTEGTREVLRASISKQQTQQKKENIT